MIDIQKRYRTRRGLATRIYATDGAGESPIHGAEQHGDRWDIRTWAADGAHYAGAWSQFDLVEIDRAEELTHETHWSSLRSKVKRVLLNIDGVCYACAASPKLSADNTCVASRHAQRISEWLMDPENVGLVTSEPRRCATSILCVVELLWKARDRIAELESKKPESEIPL